MGLGFPGIRDGARLPSALADLPRLLSSHCSFLPRVCARRHGRGLSAVGIYMKRVPFHFHKVPGGSAAAPPWSPHRIHIPRHPRTAVACAPRPGENLTVSLLMVRGPPRLREGRGWSQTHGTLWQARSPTPRRAADWSPWTPRPGIGLQDAGSKLLLLFFERKPVSRGAPLEAWV